MYRVLCCAVLSVLKAQIISSTHTQLPPAPMFTMGWLKTAPFQLRKFTAKKNSSNALMESVNLAGLGEEYRQVSKPIHMAVIYVLLFILGLFSWWRRLGNSLQKRLNRVQGISIQVTISRVICGQKWVNWDCSV